MRRNILTSIQQLLYTDENSNSSRSLFISQSSDRIALHRGARFHKLATWSLLHSSGKFRTISISCSHSSSLQERFAVMMWRTFIYGTGMTSHVGRLWLVVFITWLYKLQPCCESVYIVVCWMLTVSWIQHFCAKKTMFAFFVSSDLDHWSLD